MLCKANRMFWYMPSREDTFREGGEVPQRRWRLQSAEGKLGPILAISSCLFIMFLQTAGETGKIENSPHFFRRVYLVWNVKHKGWKNRTDDRLTANFDWPSCPLGQLRIMPFSLLFHLSDDVSVKRKNNERSSHNARLSLAPIPSCLSAARQFFILATLQTNRVWHLAGLQTN